MKRLLFIISIISLASCQNKKAYLVDLDKGYRDSARKYFDLAGICLDADFKSHPHKTALERLRTNDTSDAIPKEAMRRCDDLMRKSAHFKILADSIEWELKKY
jgi:hypothetical protein